MDKINDLLKLYFDGKTSLEQEKKLNRYFASGNILPEHQAYKPFFAAFREIGEEQFPKKMTLETTTEKIQRPKRIAFYFASGVAASVLLLIGISRFNSDNYVIINGKRINDTALAQALATEKLNLATAIFEKNIKAIEQLEVVSKNLEPQERTEKTLQNIQNKIN